MAVVTRFYGTGRRKTSVARVWLRAGSGRILVNRRPFEDYFPRETLRMVISQPLQLTNTLGQFDAVVNVGGGGPTGQAGAVRHGIARALLQFDDKLRQTLKRAGLLTRDPRMKERKKYGQPGARSKFQYEAVARLRGRPCCESRSPGPVGTWARSCCACSPCIPRCASPR